MEGIHGCLGLVLEHILHFSSGDPKAFFRDHRVRDYSKALRESRSGKLKDYSYLVVSGHKGLDWPKCRLRCFMHLVVGPKHTELDFCDSKRLRTLVMRAA